MSERTSSIPDKVQFGDVYQSRFYQFGPEIQLPGDPETSEDFARARSYLETITHHLLAFGPVWDKQPQDVVYELDYHNAWHQYEVEQERKAGEQAEYREINLHNLSALSNRRVLALEETGWAVTQDYQVVRHIDNLISAAVLEQEQLEQLMAVSYPHDMTAFRSSSHQAEEAPF